MRCFEQGLEIPVFPMIRPTAFALAFVNASAKEIKEAGERRPNWVALTVQDRVTHTNRGMVVDPDRVNVSGKTRRNLRIDAMMPVIVKN